HLSRRQRTLSSQGRKSQCQHLHFHHPFLELLYRVITIAVCIMHWPRQPDQENIECGITYLNAVQTKGPDRILSSPTMESINDYLSATRPVWQSETGLPMLKPPGH